MSNDLYDDDEHPDIVKMREHIKNLEKQNKDLAPKAERADKAERVLAFAKAGIDISSSKAKYFMAGYDGDPEDVEAIKAAAVADGFLDTPTVVAGAADEDDAAALARRNEAMSGGAPTLPASYQQELAAANSAAEVEAIAAKYGRLASVD